MFDGHENHDITLAAAAELTKRYRDQLSAGELKGGFFGKDALLRILNQNDCVGIRFYYGLNTQDIQVMVLAGALANGDDMTEGVLAEASFPCPTFCGDDNVLNT